MDEDVIVSDPEVLGGTPVFKGTRVPISVLVENLCDGLSLDEILEAYPTVSREQAVYVLRRAEKCTPRELTVQHQGKGDLYDWDFDVWARRQADLLRERRFDEIDLAHLVDEVESIRRQLAHELQDRMANIVRLRLLLHALPNEPWRPFWQLTLRQQCHMNELIVRDAPSLKDQLPRMLADARETGRLCAVEELAYAYPQKRFDDVFDAMPPLGIEDLIGLELR